MPTINFSALHDLFNKFSLISSEISLVKRETAINITETDKVRLKTEINETRLISITSLVKHPPGAHVMA